MHDQVIPGHAFLLKVFLMADKRGLHKNMKKEEFYFDSRDHKSQIHAVRWTPDSANVAGVVQIVHGMSEYVERYEEFAAYLTERNFVVTGEDHLGHGKTVQEGSTQGYFCEKDSATVVVRDVHRLKKKTQELYPGVPYFILGHSMGSFILRNYICRYGTGIDGAIIMGTGMLPSALLRLSKMIAAVVGAFRGQKHVSHFIDKLAFGGYNKHIKEQRTSFDWLSRDEKKVDEYINDKDCGFIFTVNGFKTLFELIMRANTFKNLLKVPKTLPVLIVSGEEDPVGDYGKGVQKVYQSLLDAELTKVELNLYEGNRHELLNELDRKTIMTDLCSWLEKNLVIQEQI